MQMKELIKRVKNGESAVEAVQSPGSAPKDTSSPSDLDVFTFVPGKPINAYSAELSDLSHYLYELEDKYNVYVKALERELLKTKPESIENKARFKEWLDDLANIDKDFSSDLKKFERFISNYNKRLKKTVEKFKSKLG